MNRKTGKNEDRPAINDELFIALFRKASHEFLEGEFLDELPGDGAAKDVTFSEGFEKRMQKIIHGAIRKQKRARTSRFMLKFAAGLVIFLLVSSMLVINVEALRIRVMNFLVDTREEITNVDINDDNKEPSPTGEGTLSELPEYMPEGYVLSSSEDLNSKKKFEYKNGEGNTILITVYRDEFGASIDTEIAEYEKIIVNGKEGFYSYKNGRTALVFKSKSDILYYIKGEIDLSEALKIAESIN